MLISLFLLSAFFILLYYYVLHYRKFVRYINNIPGMPTLPFVGHTLVLSTYSQENFWKLLRTLAKKYYPIYKLWFGPVAVVSIHHPDDVEKVLNSTKRHLEKSYIYTFVQPWLGSGIITSKETKWHKRRKMLTPTFHFNILKQFADILVEEGNRMTKSLKVINGSVVDDLVSFISEHTLNAICETATNTSLPEIGEFQHQYRQAIHEMGNITFYRLMRPWLYPDIIFALTSTGRKQAKYLKILHEFTEKIIAKRKQYHERTDGQYLKYFENDTDVIETDNEEVMGIKKKRLIMLDLLIAAARNNEINDADIREEVDTFMFAGHDTVTMALTFALLVLAEHKDSQERIRSEVNAVMRENGGKLTMTALNNLSYLERCLKESLRLYPSGPLISRVTSEDIKIQSYLVPSGTTLFLSIYDIHRDSNFWSNPDVFDPDRFLPERIEKRHPYSYLPFSAGPRNCLGKRFAMMELKIIIALLVRNFHLEPIDYLNDFQFMVDFVIRVTHPIRIRFVPIHESDL